MALCCLAVAATAQKPAEFVRKHYGKKQGEYPDFSYAGYHAGRELPSRNYDLPVFNVTDFGAVANDGKDDIDAIQAAVDAAQAAGGGVVSFPAGRFDFDVSTKHRWVKVKSSRVVLRGYGDGPDGTHLYDHTGSDWHNESQKWLAGNYPSFFSFAPDSMLRDDALAKRAPLATARPTPQHSMMLTVDKPQAFKAGQVVQMGIKAEDSSVLHYCAYPSKVIGKNIGSLQGSKAYVIKQMLRIERVEGNNLILQAPLLVPIKDNWTAHLFEINYIEECGVENFRMITAWSDEFVHHKNSRHDNGWDCVKFNRVADGWVRNCTFINTSMAVGFGTVLNGTIYDCRILGNRGHNGYIIGSSTSCLLMNLQSSSQMHTFGLTNTSSGNVFYNCMADDPAGIDCHGGLGVYNLVDNMQGAIYASGGATGNTPPGIGHGLIFWNWRSGNLHPYNFRIRPNSVSVIATPGVALVGVRNKDGRPLAWFDQYNKLQTSQPRGPWIWVENLNGTPSPLSLYSWLYRRRTGNELPQEPPRIRKGDSAGE